MSLLKVEMKSPEFFSLQGNLSREVEVMVAGIFESWIPKEMGSGEEIKEYAVCMVVGMGEQV